MAFHDRHDRIFMLIPRAYWKYRLPKKSKKKTQKKRKEKITLNTNISKPPETNVIFIFIIFDLDLYGVCVQKENFERRQRRVFRESSIITHISQ